VSQGERTVLDPARSSQLPPIAHSDAVVAFGPNAHFCGTRARPISPVYGLVPEAIGEDTFAAMARMLTTSPLMSGRVS
jgi:hypothetical protein